MTQEFWKKQFDNQLKYFNNLVKSGGSDERYYSLFYSSMHQLLYFKMKMETFVQPLQGVHSDWPDWKAIMKKNPIGTAYFHTTVDEMKSNSPVFHKKNVPDFEEKKEMGGSAGDWFNKNDNISGHQVIFKNGKAEVPSGLLTNHPFLAPPNWDNADLDDVPVDWMPEKEQKCYFIDRFGLIGMRCRYDVSDDVFRQRVGTRLFPTERLAIIYRESLKGKPKES